MCAGRIIASNSMISIIGAISPATHSPIVAPEAILSFAAAMASCIEI